MADNFANSLNVLEQDVLLAPASGFIVTDLSAADAEVHVVTVPDYYLDSENKLSFKVFFTNGWSTEFSLNVSDLGAKSVKYYKDGEKVPLEASGTAGTVLEMFWDGTDFVVSGNSISGGGTGNEEILEADYEDLTEEEKNNGTAYYIPDADAVDFADIDDSVTTDNTTWSSAKIAALISNQYPIGSTILFTSDNIPFNWLPCDGREVLRSDYPELYQLYKDTPLGVGDGSTTFNLPDFRNRVPQGADDNLGEKIEAGLPNITGSGGNGWNYGEFGNQWKGAISRGYGIAGINGSGDTVYSFNFNAANGETKLDGTLQNDVYGKSDTVQPPAFTTNFIVKVRQAVDSTLPPSIRIDDNSQATDTVWSSNKTASTLNDALLNYPPIGSVMAYAGRTAPTGWLICDGSDVSMDTYSALYNALKNEAGECIYGENQSNRSFKLPDLRETAIVGVGTRGSGVTAHDEYTIGEFKDDQLQGFRIIITNNIGSGGTNNYYPALGTASHVSPDSDKNITALYSDGTNGDPRIGTTTHGKQMGMNYIIRY